MGAGVGYFHTLHEQHVIYALAESGRKEQRERHSSQLAYCLKPQSTDAKTPDSIRRFYKTGI
jgi:hypothetical protein